MSRVLLFLACLCALGMAIFVDVPGGYRYTDAIQNWAHAPAFGLIAIGFLRLGVTPNSRFSHRHYAFAAGAALLLGVAVEVAQSFLQRDADAQDVLQDALGIAVALPTHALWFRGQSKLGARAVRALLVTATLAAMGAMAPLMYCAAAYWHRAQSFPEIASFRSPLDLYFLRRFDPPSARLKLPSQYSHSGDEQTLFAPYGDHPWPGIVFEEPAPNWRGYRQLVVDVANPNPAPLSMILTIHDRHYDGKPEDRFDRTFRVPARERLVLRIPLEQIAQGPQARRLNLSEVWRMAIAQERGPLHQPGFFLNRVALE